MDGQLGVAEARARVDDRVALEVDDDRVRVRLLLFAMCGLHWKAMPYPAFNYREALWLVGITRGALPAWYALACDLDAFMVRTLGAILVRYPVRRAAFQVTDD